MSLYRQATTGVVHTTKNCGVTRRTRYNHFEVVLSVSELAASKKCRRCFDVETRPEVQA